MNFFKELSQDLLGRGNEDREALCDIMSCCREPNAGVRIAACMGRD